MKIRVEVVKSPDADLEYAAEVLRVGGDKSANVYNELLLQHCLDWIKRKTAVVEDTLYVLRRHRLVNHFLILAPHTDGQLTQHHRRHNNNNNQFISIVVKPLRRTASTHHIYTEPVLARRPEQPVTNNKV